MQTLFRAIMMLLAVAVLWKGWQQYGPTKAQLKSMASQALEIASRALDGAETLDGAMLNPDDPRTAAPSFAASTTSRVDATPMAGNATAELGALHTPPLLPAPSTIASLEGATTTPTDDTSAAPADGEADSVFPLPADVEVEDQSSRSQLELALARLEELGVRDHQLESWGEGGKLYRFSCRVPWGQSANFARHFESVAAEPLAAVEAVAAKVDMLRGGQP